MARLAREGFFFCVLLVVAGLAIGDVGCASGSALQNLPLPRSSTQQSALDFRQVAATIATKHVLTWVYDDTGAGGMGATAAQVQAFTNFAEEWTEDPPGKAEKDCYPGASRSACQAVWYIRATFLYAQETTDKHFLEQLDSENLINDAGFYHNNKQISADRVINSGPAVVSCQTTRSGPCFFPNLSNQNVINFVVKCLLQGGSGAACDNQSFRGPTPGTELFEDRGPAVCINQNNVGIYFPGGSSSFGPAELGSGSGCDRSLQANMLTFLAALKYSDGTPARAWLNGYTPLCGTKTCAYPPGDATYWTVGSTPAMGVVDEGTVCGSFTSPNSGFAGAIVLDDMAQLFNESRSGDFVLLNYSAASAGSGAQLQMRRYCDGIFWLGFNLNRSVLWSDYSNGGRNMFQANILAVYPEQQIVPTNPIMTMGDTTPAIFGHNGTGCNASGRFDTTMRGGAKGLVVACGEDSSGDAAGVYTREFRQCYSWGSLVGSGQCAVVVNMTANRVTIGGSPSQPWRYPTGKNALSQNYNEMLILSGADMVTDGCSPASGCRTGSGTDLNFGGVFALYSSQVDPGDAAYLFHS